MDAQEYVGKRLKLTGQWTGKHLLVTRVQESDPKKDPQRGKVEGIIDSTDHKQKTIKLGPVIISWDITTRFVGISAIDLTSGRKVEIKGKLTSPGNLMALEIELKEKEINEKNVFQILGAVSDSEKRAGNSNVVTILGIPAVIPHTLEAPVSALTRRIDDKRPDEQFTLNLFARPLTIGGEVGITTRDRKDFEFDQAQDDLSRLDLGLEIEFLYHYSKNMIFFVEGAIDYEDELNAEDNKEKSDTVVKRGESWIYFRKLFGTSLGFQVGRQSFQEDREWWWDESLDSIRLYYSNKSFQFEIGLGQELAKTATDENQLDPEEEDVFRIVSNGNFQYRRSHRLDVFVLFQNDHSETENVGQISHRDEEDDRDADILWFGARASGKFKLNSLGKIYYWLDSAYMTGEETTIEYDDVLGNFSEVEEQNKQDIGGWALDLGMTWLMPLPLEPTLTFGYALGSGDKNPHDNKDENFRQTGLQDNNGKFRGVDRFRYYGELLQPELSNLWIGTVSLGFPLMNESSIEIVYHHYQQLEASDSLRDGRIKADPEGKNQHIGDEIDLVIGIEEWKHWEIELIGALFRAGNAYGRLSGETATNVLVKVNYNF